MDVSQKDFPSPSSRRIIKRYSNRKLYDTRESRYVTLLEIAEMIRAGEDVQVVDNDTKADKTDVTLAVIISEELRSRPRAIPLATLRALIRHHSGRLLTGLREGPMARFLPHETHEQAGSSANAGHAPLQDGPSSEPAEEALNQSLELGQGAERDSARGLFGAIEHWQHLIDDRIRAVLRGYSTLRELEQSVSELKGRVACLERELASAASRSPERAGTAARLGGALPSADEVDVLPPEPSGVVAARAVDGEPPDAALNSEH